MSTASPLARTQELGARFWNDSCDLRELEHAVRAGAVGATSNPVIVAQAVDADPTTWYAELDALIAANAGRREDEIAWLWVARVAARAAALLAPVYERTGGMHGCLCVQTDPRAYSDAARMSEHGRELAALAPNIAVKVPATAAGITAIEALTAAGIRINATVSFSVAQAVGCAEAVERGEVRARRSGLVPRPSWITLMVGRIDDHVQRVTERDHLCIEPGAVARAGIAVFKRAHAVFAARGFGS